MSTARGKTNHAYHNPHSHLSALQQTSHGDVDDDVHHDGQKPHRHQLYHNVLTAQDTFVISQHTHAGICAHTHTHTQGSEWTLFSRTEDTAKQKVTWKSWQQTQRLQMCACLACTIQLSTKQCMLAYTCLVRQTQINAAHSVCWCVPVC